MISSKKQVQLENFFVGTTVFSSSYAMYDSFKNFVPSRIFLNSTVFRTE